MFGLFGKNAAQPSPGDDPRIYARLSDLIKLQYQSKGFSLLPKQPVQSLLTGHHGSRLRGRGLNFEELRHYRPGDDIRSLDWKVTNRTRKPHVRVYTEERERSVVIVVDQRISMFFGSRNKMKSVVATEIAALVAWRVVDVGDRIGAVIFDDQNLLSIAAKRSRENVIHILSRTVEVNRRLSAGRQSQPGQYDACLKYLGRHLSHDMLIVSISDGYGWNAETTRLVRRIGRHNDIIAINIFDPAEVTLPRITNMIVSDGYSQIDITGNRRQLDRRFTQQYEHDLGVMRTELKRVDIPLIPVDTVQPAYQQLIKALGGRAR